MFRRTHILNSDKQGRTLDLALELGCCRRSLHSILNICNIDGTHEMLFHQHLTRVVEKQHDAKGYEK